MRDINKKKILLYIAFITGLCVILNLPASITVGVDGVYSQVEMPLYVKWTQFLARHYEYGRISREITAGCKAKKEKVLKILGWTHNNIKQDIPEGMPVKDDHILNIIIRGYGTPGQSQDVFTTLCAYSGMRAFWDKFYNRTGKVSYPLSFVKFDGKWHVFDSFRGIYCIKKDGSIATVEDILNKVPVTSNAGPDAGSYRGVPYMEFYDGIKPINDSKTLRPEKQMPLKRAYFEFKKLLGIKNNENACNQ